MVAELDTLDGDQTQGAIAGSASRRRLYQGYDGTPAGICGARIVDARCGSVGSRTRGGAQDSDALDARNRRPDHFPCCEPGVCEPIESELHLGFVEGPVSRHALRTRESGCSQSNLSVYRSADRLRSESSSTAKIITLPVTTRLIGSVAPI